MMLMQWKQSGPEENAVLKLVELWIILRGRRVFPHLFCSGSQIMTHKNDPNIIHFFIYKPFVTLKQSVSQVSLCSDLLPF